MLLGLLACTAPGDTGETAVDPGCVPDLGLYEVGADSTEIHVSTAFDGQRLWASWVRPNDASTFDVVLSALDCAGEEFIGPIAVTDSPDNEIDPALAVSGDRVLLAWPGSDGGMSIRTRVYNLDGDPLTEVTPFVGTRDGVPVTGNATGPRLRPTDDGWVMAGFWGHDDAPAFQAFHVTLDRDGLPVGDATDAQLDVDFGQTAVDLVVDPLVLAWQEDSTTSTESTLQSSDGSLDTPGLRPTLAHNDGLWAAWDDDQGTVTLRPPGAEPIDLPLDGFHHSPRLTGDALLTMKVEDGVYNSLHLHRVDASGLVASVELPTTTAPSVYGVDLTPVGEDRVAVGYADGQNPDFQARVLVTELP